VPPATEFRLIILGIALVWLLVQFVIGHVGDNHSANCITDGGQNYVGSEHTTRRLRDNRGPDVGKHRQLRQRRAAHPMQRT
jgi:hypothetical protein